MTGGDEARGEEARGDEAPDARPETGGDEAPETRGDVAPGARLPLLAFIDRFGHRVPTPELNRFLGDVVATRPPPQKQGHRLKLLYIAQIGDRPPRYSIQVNSRQKVTRDYAYFVENRLRERYALEGIPVIIDFAERKQRRRAA